MAAAAFTTISSGNNPADKKSVQNLDLNLQAGLKNKPYVLTVLKDGEY